MPRRPSTLRPDARHPDRAAAGPFACLAAMLGFAFSGRFRGDSQILIIARGGGYHRLIAGLSRIDVSVNRRLAANQPVGAMSLTQSDNTKRYLEMRREGRPINPLPLAAAKNG